MRIYLLYLVVAALAVYAWKDWFKSLCALIVLTAVLELPDMPRTMAGIQGLNPWNVVMVSVLLAWAVTRRREGLIWDMPRGPSWLLAAYLGVILVSFARMVADPKHLHASTFSLFSDYLLNTLKFAIPGLLLYDGCRSKKRLVYAVSAILACYFMIALMVSMRMSYTAIFSESTMLARRMALARRVGYTADSLATMLAATSWAFLGLLPILRRRSLRIAAVVGSLVVLYSLLVTGARMGYAAWMVTGLVLCAMRWRKYLPVLPAIVLLVALAFPAPIERALQGFGETTVTGKQTANAYEISSGRFVVWPYVIRKIAKSP
ncbi:MAG: hypothetical protein J7M21_04715, partial [Planctomycetes bacterium]|nr:hypothetical protein [Planctomycetota bacterium]